MIKQFPSHNRLHNTSFGRKIWDLRKSFLWIEQFLGSSVTTKWSKVHLHSGWWESQLFESSLWWWGLCSSFNRLIQETWLSDNLRKCFSFKEKWSKTTWNWENDCKGKQSAGILQITFCSLVWELYNTNRRFTNRSRFYSSKKYFRFCTWEQTKKNVKSFTQ